MKPAKAYYPMKSKQKEDSKSWAVSRDQKEERKIYKLKQTWKMPKEKEQKKALPIKPPSWNSPKINEKENKYFNTVGATKKPVPSEDLNPKFINKTPNPTNFTNQRYETYYTQFEK